MGGDYVIDEIFFDGFINNCLSYSVEGIIENLTGKELVGNDWLEELELLEEFMKSPVKFTSLGKVKKLKISECSSLTEIISVDFEDNSLTQIEVLDIGPESLPLLDRIMKLSKKLNKVTFNEYYSR